jgi:hypothetical protein
MAAADTLRGIQGVGLNQKLDPGMMGGAQLPKPGGTGQSSGFMDGVGGHSVAAGPGSPQYVGP